MEINQFLECDVLIVGAGLAGLRAGIAALSEKSELRIYIVTGMRGASGSSFTNRNNALGMMVCHNEREKEAFFQTAMSIAGPGMIKPDLVRILAEESDELFHDLIQMGLHFNRSVNEGLLRYNGCFMPEQALAYVFTGLSDAHGKLTKRFKSLGGRIIEGYQLAEVLTCEDNRFSGAVFVNSSNDQTLGVIAKTFIAATGGTAGLFRRHIAGRGLTGFTYGVLKKTGIRFVNTGYFQFLWYDTKTMEHWPCWALAAKSMKVRGKSAKPLPLPERLRDLCVVRSHHIPLQHGGEDSEIDRFIVDESNDDSSIEIHTENVIERHVALYAHASNGGIRIDEQGATSVPGLFACGECAGGMHGANRVGGAMLTATQVFGQRAGISAVRFSEAINFEHQDSFRKKAIDVASKIHIDHDEWIRGFHMVSHDLGKTAGPNIGHDSSILYEKYSHILETTMDWRLTRTIETVLIILENMS